MKLKRVIPIIAAAAVCALGPAAAVASAATNSVDVQQASSENWAGYVVGDGSSGDYSQSSSQTFKSVTGSWTQPTAKCDPSTGRTYSAFWVGLGGSGNSQSLQQAGTEADCTASGTASYHAWYEEVPAAPVTVNLAVHPGDKMTATTTVNGDQVTESIANHTTGQSFSKTLTVNRAGGPDTSSAEWIAEAPSQCGQSTSSCTPLPLTNFGKVNFTSASATDSSGHTGPISDSAWSAAAVTLDPGASSMGFQGASLTDASSSGGATPGSLSSDGSSFSVAYGAAGSSAPTSTGTGSGGYPGGSGGYPGGSGGFPGGSGGYPGTGGYGYPGGGYGYPGDGYGYGYGGDGYGYGYGGGYGYDSGYAYAS